MKTTPTHSFLLALALAAVALPGFAAEPVNIAMLEGTTKKVVSGSGVEGTGFSGGTKIDDLFDGNLKNCTRLSYIGADGYIQIDFPEAYFVTSINVTKWYRHKYSLSISADGTNWTPVDYATSVNRYGTKNWGVYNAASHVRMSFPEASTHCEDVAELEIWGIPVSGMTCAHSNLSPWTEIANSATCTTPALEQATCAECGEIFTRMSGSLPLGHECKSNVLEPGVGWFSCPRCGLVISCMDGPIELTSYGTMTFDDSFAQFVDYQVSAQDLSEGDGTRSNLLFDHDLGTAWTSPQRSSGYADISFNTPVHLTKVEIKFGGWNGMWATAQMKELFNGQEQESTFFNNRVQMGDSNSGTLTANFTDLDLKAFRIYFSNNWNDYNKVYEIRVYGTVPGEVNYTPALILMQ